MTAEHQPIPPSLRWAEQQYAKIQDFVISNRLYQGLPSTKSHADVVLELAQEALDARRKTAEEAMRCRLDASMRALVKGDK